MSAGGVGVVLKFDGRRGLGWVARQNRELRHVARFATLRAVKAEKELEAEHARKEREQRDALGSRRERSRSAPTAPAASVAGANALAKPVLEYELYRAKTKRNSERKDADQGQALRFRVYELEAAEKVTLAAMQLGGVKLKSLEGQVERLRARAEAAGAEADALRKTAKLWEVEVGKVKADADKLVKQSSTAAETLRKEQRRSTQSYEQLAARTALLADRSGELHGLRISLATRGVIKRAKSRLVSDGASPCGSPIGPIAGLNNENEAPPPSKRNSQVAKAVRSITSQKGRQVSSLFSAIGEQRDPEHLADALEELGVIDELLETEPFWDRRIPQAQALVSKMNSTWDVNFSARMKQKHLVSNDTMDEMWIDFSHWRGGPKDAPLHRVLLENPKNQKQCVFYPEPIKPRKRWSTVSNAQNSLYILVSHLL